MKFDFWFWQFFSPSLTIKNVLFRRLAIDLVCRDFSEKRNVCLGHASISTQKLASILECLTKRILSKGIVQADAAPNALAKLASLATYANYFQDEIYDHIQQGFNDQ